MTADYGSVEPVDAGEVAAQHDDLEHWLHGIRTELTDNPSDWLATADSTGDHPAPHETTAVHADDDPGVEPPREERVGRHRAED